MPNLYISAPCSVALTCTISASCYVAPTPSVRFQISFAQGTDVPQVAQKGQICEKKYYYLFFEHTTEASAHIHAHTLIPMNARTLYLYEHLRKTEPAYHLEFYEVTVGTSSSTGTSPPTECASLKILK